MIMEDVSLQAALVELSKQELVQTARWLEEISESYCGAVEAHNRHRSTETLVCKEYWGDRLEKGMDYHLDLHTQHEVLVSQLIHTVTQ